MGLKLTKARKIVLLELVARGGEATPWDLSSPRRNMMHTLEMAGYVGTKGPLNPWGEPSTFEGKYAITDAGRKALEPHNDH